MVIRYTRNRHSIPIKPQYISSQLRDVIEYSLDHDGEVDRKAYHKLSEVEQNLFRSLGKYINVDEGSGLGDDRSWHDRWSVIKGEIMSGNDSRTLKQQAREMLKHAVMIGRISRRDYSEMLDELNL